MRIHECTFSVDRNECLQLCHFWLRRIWPRLDRALHMHILLHLTLWIMLGVLYARNIISGYSALAMAFAAVTLFVTVGLLRIVYHRRRLVPAFCAALPAAGNSRFVLAIRIDESGMRARTDGEGIFLPWKSIRDIRADAHALYISAGTGLITIPRSHPDSQAWLLVYDQIRTHYRGI